MTRRKGLKAIGEFLIWKETERLNELQHCLEMYHVLHILNECHCIEEMRIYSFQISCQTLFWGINVQFFFYTLCV